MIPCLVIAEATIIKVLSSYINQLEPLLTLQGAADSLEEGMILIQLYKPGIVYIDENVLKEISGDSCLFMQKCYTVALIENDLRDSVLKTVAFDYLPKPLQFPQLANGLKKYGAYLYQSVIREYEKVNTKSDCLKLQDKNFNSCSLKLADLLHIEGMQNYVKYYSIDGTVYIKKLTMGAMLAELPASSFSRVHKSHVINDNLIDFIDRNYVYMNDLCKTKIPLGEAYRAAFFTKENIIHVRRCYSNSKGKSYLDEYSLLFLLLFNSFKIMLDSADLFGFL